MQMEMEEGGKLFFDLFVAMCNHMVGHPVTSPFIQTPLKPIKQGISFHDQTLNYLAVIYVVKHSPMASISLIILG
jgi:hypothetical protein